jgi:anti-anti-sigma regulatory factor
VNSLSGISAGLVGGSLWLRVESKGCFQNSADLEAFVQEQISSGATKVVIDLRNCTGMDSTFMGVLMSLARRIAKLPQGSMTIIHATGRNAQLLRGLGVHYFCTVCEDGAACETHPDGACSCQEISVPHHELDKRQQTEVCLQAHEDLAAANAENEVRFRDVIELMRKKLAAQGQ